MLALRAVSRASLLRTFQLSSCSRRAMSVKFTESHEWVKVESVTRFNRRLSSEMCIYQVDGNIATVGISDLAQEVKDGIVFVTLPDVGDDVEQG